MIFDDLFYPGDPERRQEVANLKGEIITIFKDYKAAWNDNANLLNGIFAQGQNPEYAGLTILTLEKDIESDTVGECINEINDAISDAKIKLDKLWRTLSCPNSFPRIGRSWAAPLARSERKMSERSGKSSPSPRPLLTAMCLPASPRRPC